MSCTSTNITLSDKVPVAVVTVTANHTLPWLNEETSDGKSDDAADDPDGLLTYAVNKLISGNNVEMTSDRARVDYAAESLNHLLEETGGFTVVPKKEVISASFYRKSRENILNYMVALVSADGYKNFMTMGSKNARILMDQIGAKSLVMANFTFQKARVSGNKWNGEAAAYAKMEIRLLDSRGKELMDREYSAISINTVPIRDRGYNKEELVELFPEAIDIVINKFVVDCMQ
ncbi:MAG: hypothetical protein IJS09_07295 [Treponema sp.]|nr:hypothetical protein [Treponema sp.]